MAKTLIWLVDRHKLRREGMVGFLAKWATQSSVELRQVERPEHIYPAELLDAETVKAQLGVLGLGAASMADEDTREFVKDVLEVLAGRPLIVILDEVDDAEAERAKKLGIKGIIATTQDSEVAFRAISFVLAGGSYFPHLRSTAPGISSSRPSDMATVHAPLPEKTTEPLDEETALVGQPNEELIPGERLNGLTQRQTEVLEALRRGHSNKLIARDLNLSEATVKIHVRTLIRKFGVTNRTQVALKARDGSITRH